MASIWLKNHVFADIVLLYREIGSKAPFPIGRLLCQTAKLRIYHPVSTMGYTGTWFILDGPNAPGDIDLWLEPFSSCALPRMLPHLSVPSLVGREASRLNLVSLRTYQLSRIAEGRILVRKGGECQN